jgi:uncharacterized SAM-binding protein YcdF (DUF218 family)
VTRVLAVLGYSKGRGNGLHPICAARLARAAELAEDDDLVILSGWARRRSTLSEAELMRSAWRGASSSVVCDSLARTTAENAFAVAALARVHDADKVLVVTSSWHAPRARFVFRTALRNSGAQLDVVRVGDRRRLGPALRELGRWPLVPFALALARRSRPG